MSNTKVGQRKTKQREIILALINQAPGPISVNEIAEQLSDKNITIGIATIYRTINLLEENKLIHCIRLQDAVQRYEKAGVPHHHHFHCEICDTVYDIEGCYLHFHDKDQKIPEGHKITSHEITFRGMCKNCQSQLSCNS